MQRLIAVFALLIGRGLAHGQDLPITVEKQEGKLAMRIAGRPFAEYHHAGELRPFFANVYASEGIKATRNFPMARTDQQDHPHHQGIFVTFGDLNGIDYWHGKGKTVHAGFTTEPKNGTDRIAFAVKNHFLAKDEKQPLCTENARYTIRVAPLTPSPSPPGGEGEGVRGVMMEFDSTFTAEQNLRIGSKEEGGLAVRMATPLAVINGGRMVDDEGRINGKEIWGKKAKWVDYSGKLAGQEVGIMVMTHPENPRPSWWHARDYGLLAANPFGPLGSKDGGMTLAKGQTLRLRYAVLVHAGKSFEPTAAYTEYAQRTK